MPWIYLTHLFPIYLTRLISLDTMLCGLRLHICTGAEHLVHAYHWSSVWRSSMQGTRLTRHRSSLWPDGNVSFELFRGFEIREREKVRERFEAGQTK
jgi:hypothetical protein